MSEPVSDALGGLPVPAERRLAVRVTADAIRQIRGGSPWVYDGSITSVSRDGAPGDLAVVFDDHRKFVAIGLWDPGSPIRIRILHHGSPSAIERTWFRARLGDALERRRSLTADPATTAYRWVHGENDGLPALVVDRYERTLVVKPYTAAWFPHLRPVVDALVELADPERVVLRLGRTVGAGETFGLSDGDTVFGDPPDGPVLFRERGLVMEADVVHGNKTGHFLDQRDNRALVRGMAGGKDVLDVFSSTGGFALSAAAGGARSVHLVDASEGAIATARRNLDHNRHVSEVRRCHVHTTTGDAFAVLRHLAAERQAFDLVVLDPPSFASNQAAIPRALQAYSRLTRAGLAVLAEGGALVQASCSSRVTADDFADVVLETARALRPRMRELRRTGHPADHPIGFAQGAYLKAIYLTESPGRSPQT